MSVVGSAAQVAHVGFARTLVGTKVLELGSNIAGPMAGMILSDAGADVVKVEDPRGGDATRSLHPIVDGESAVFRAFNRGKRSVAFDMTSAEGRDAVLRLAAASDVVISSLRPGLAASLGIGFEDVVKVRPDVVYCAVSAFGEGALGQTMPGYDALVQAFSGIMASTGQPGDERPVRASASLLDTSTAMWAALGVMAALLRRDEQSPAQLVEASLLDSAFTMMGHQISGYLATGEVPVRLGSASPSFAPYGAYSASDGFFFMAAGTDRQFARLCRLLELNTTLDDPRFETAERRAGNRVQLDAVLQPILSTRPLRHWVEEFSRAGIPSCRVNDLGEALSSEVAVERDLLSAPSISRTQRRDLLRLPVDRGRTEQYTTPPQLGEHGRQVLTEAGFTPEQIRVLLFRDAAQPV
jgi:crotonobetainyl-CoA:carnitine CoA-transferase CaiB-like acyl-CoA transferase